VLVERVRADVLFRCEQVQLFPRHKPQKRSFAGTYRAIACHRPIEFAFDLERKLAAVAATPVFHVRSPSALLFVGALTLQPFCDVTTKV